MKAKLGITNCGASSRVCGRDCFAEEVADLSELWMQVVDEWLEDDELLDAVYDAQGRRCPQSRIADFR